MNWWTKRYFVTPIFPPFQYCMLLQIRLPWKKIIHNGIRSIKSCYKEDICKEITGTSIERTNLSQIITLIKIIKRTITAVHFPKELNQKRSQNPNWSCNYKLPLLSPTFKLFSAFHTIFWIFGPLNQLLSLACGKIFPVSKLLNSPKIFPSLQKLSVSLHLILI